MTKFTRGVRDFIPSFMLIGDESIAIESSSCCTFEYSNGERVNLPIKDAADGIFRVDANPFESFVNFNGFGIISGDFSGFVFSAVVLRRCRFGMKMILLLVEPSLDDDEEEEEDDLDELLLFELLDELDDELDELDSLENFFFHQSANLRSGRLLK